MTLRDRRRARGSTTAGTRTDVELTEHGAVFTANGHALTLHVVREPDDERLAQVTVAGRATCTPRSTSSAGQIRGVVLESAADGPPREIRVGRDPAAVRRDRAASGASWLAGSTYTGRWREAVQRSAITLKLMTYAPDRRPGRRPDRRRCPSRSAASATGTTATPGSATPRSRCTRCCGSGFVEEAGAVRPRGCGDRVRERVGSDSGPLNIMYRVDGSSDLKEDVLDHWRGLPRLAPGADRQRRRRAAAARHLRRGAGQHLRRRPSAACRCRPPRAGRRSADVLDWLADNWDQPEEGIWETRGGRQDFTYGRVMCWVAFDRGIRLATEHGRPAPLERWTAERDAIYEQVMERGWNAERGRRSCSTTTPTCWTPSLLRMPTVGFIAPQRPDVAVDPGRDGRRAGHRQPGLPLRPGGLPGRAARLGGHVLAVHVRLRRRAGPRRPARRGPAGLREDAHLRQPRRACTPRRSP